MTNLLTGCVASELIIGGLSATSAYYSHRAASVTLHSAECASDMLRPDEGYQKRWTDSEKRQLLAHIRFHQDECQQEN